MKVRELIDILNKVTNKELEVLIDNSCEEYGPCEFYYIGEAFPTQFSTSSYILLDTLIHSDDVSPYSDKRYLTLWKNESVP